MNKHLTQELKDYYWNLAKEKVESDREKIKSFIQENDLTSITEEYHEQSENYVLTTYEVAKKMWEIDGYVEPLSNYRNFSEFEGNFCQNIFQIINDKFIKESHEKMDRQFLELVDKIIKGEKETA